jgi:hypothetical protein
MKRYWQCQKCGIIRIIRETSPLLCTASLGSGICGGWLKELTKKEYKLKLKS